MLNEATLAGNLGRDPEVRTLNNGDKVANLALATSETWKDRETGERKERTEWHRVTVWGPLAGICEQYLRKGSKVLIRGRLETRKWQDQSGQDRYTTEVVLRGPQALLKMLDGPKQGGQQAQQPQQEPTQDYGGGSSGAGAGGYALSDEIPFGPCR